MPEPADEPQSISDPHRTFSATVVCNECGWTERGWVEDIERLTRQHTKDTEDG